jgi:Cys-tRNA(Pro) deacylase
MHPSAPKVADAAANLGIEIKIVEFDQTTRTATDAANAIGCQVAQIVKSLLFIANEQPIIALVSGSNRLDERKLAHLRGCGRKKINRPDADQTKDITGYSIGGVPPFGHKSPLTVYIDEDLISFDIIWAAAGTPNSVFAVTPQALVQATQGEVADLKQDIENPA